MNGLQDCLSYTTQRAATTLLLIAMSRQSRSHRWLKVILAGAKACMLGIATPAWSQSGRPGLSAPSFPAPIQQPLPPEPLIPETSPLRGVPEPSRPLPGSTESEAIKLSVTGFRFTGNTVFRSEALLDTITNRFEQNKINLERPLSFSELNEASQAVSQLYIDNGYTTSGAYIPVQRISDGVVEIRIVEGRLGDLSVDVQKGRLKPGYVRSRILRASRGALNLNRLTDELRLLQVNPLIRTIKAKLSASSTPGLSNLQVNVVGAPTLAAAAAMDNGRNPQTGSFRRGVDLGIASVFGYGDGLSITYRNSDGSNDVLASYQVPINSSDLTLTLTGRTLDSWIIQKPLSELDITFLYQQFFVGLRQPLIRRVDEELALGLGINRQSSKGLFLQGLPYPGRGVDQNGESRVTTLSFSQDWTRRSTSQVLSLRSEVGVGQNWFDATTPAYYPQDPNSPDARFLFWRADSQYVRKLGTNTLLVARGRAQLADGPLPSVEQFGLGGLGSVQGYQTNSLLTDNGLFASLELALPILNWQQRQGTLQLVPFTAIGHGWDAGPGIQPEVNVLASLGLGLQLRLGSNFFGRVDYAQRLGRAPYYVTDIWQDQAILFTLRHGL